jgi:hypothetical protein
VTALAGGWDRAEARDDLRRLRTGSETYYADLDGARADIDFDETTGRPLLIAQVADDAADRIADISGCPAS